MADAATYFCCCHIGGKVTRDAGPVKGGKTVIAFVEDPTGYKWELITREEPIPEPIAQVPFPSLYSVVYTLISSYILYIL